jgi:hypothetical protein
VKVPPQLIGIIDDARRAGVDTFTLEYSRGLVMAAFSAGNHATEIDFEREAGEEMLQYLKAGAADTSTKQWAISCTYDSETYDLLVERTGSSSRGPLRIKWSPANHERGT